MILNLIEVTLAKLRIFYLESKILKFILYVVYKTSVIFSESFLYKGIIKFANLLKVLFLNSKLGEFVVKDNFLIKTWDKSVSFILITRVLNYPANLLKNKYEKVEKYFENTLVIAFFLKIFKRFEVIVALTLCIIILIPDHLWFNMYTAVAILILLILYVIKAVVQKYEKFNIRALDFVLLLFMISIIISLFISTNIGLSARFLLFNISSFMFLIIIVSVIKNNQYLARFLNVLLIGIAITAIYGVWQAITKSIPFDPSLTDVNLNQGMPGRIYSTFGNSNNYAKMLVMMIPYYGAKVLNEETVFGKIIFSALGTISIVALGYTGTRAAWIAVAFSIFILCALKNKKLIPFMLLGGLMSFFFLPDYIRRRILTIFQASNDSSFQYRIKIINTVLPALKDNWLWGIGLGTDTFTQIVEKYHQYTDKTPIHSHVFYMQLWIETGLMGIVTFLWFTLRTMKSAMVTMYKKLDNEITNVLAAGISSTVGILTMGFLDYIWFYPRVMLMFWVNIALILSCLNIIRNRKIKNSER